jgi:hypothetical protein
MKKALKKILYIMLAAIVVLIIVVVLAITLFANSALKIGIQTAGSKALSVPVSVDSVNLSILRGKLGMKNLVIDNPADYEHDKLLQLKSGQVKVDIGSLLSDTVRIEEIKLDGMNVVLEQKGLTSNNIQEIIKSLPKGKTSPEQEEKKMGKKLHIANLELTDITVQAKLLPVPGKSDTVKFTLSPIKMTDLGSDEKMDVAALTGKILLAIATGIAKEGAGVLPDGMVDTMKESLDITLKLGKTVGEEGKKLLDTGKEAGSGLIEGVKGLLKPKDKDN